MSENRKRIKCPVCRCFVYRAHWSKSHNDKLIGYYCKHCKMFYPTNGVKIGTDKLYLGLKQVS